MTAQTTTTAAPRAAARDGAAERRRAGALLRSLGLAVAPMLLFASIPVGLAGGFPVAGLLLGASLLLLGLDAVLFGREG